MRKLTAVTIALTLFAGQASAGEVNSALTGMNSSSLKIDAASNNIANANTAGYKPSAVELQDVYAGQSGGQSRHLTSSSTSPPAMHGSTHSGRR
jgi:flagellar hook protein FlgE